MSRPLPNLERLLWLVLALSLIPAAMVVFQRLPGESSRIEVAMVMDEPALSEQADLLGMSSLELGLRYQALGLKGIALYEDTIESLVEKGRATALLGSQAQAQALVLGLQPPPVAADSTMVSELVPGALARLAAKNMPAPERVDHLGRSWLVWPGDVRITLPAGPDLEEMETWRGAGFDIAYRPRNAPYQVWDAGSDFPQAASYLIYAGTQVSGHPGELAGVVAASQRFITFIIEGTPQDGMADISNLVPTARLLSFNQDYIDRRLTPADLIDKYLLAVEERNVRLLYLRPYTTTERGDPVANTEAMVSGLSRVLARQGYAAGPLSLLESTFSANPLLRALAGLGVLAALALLALRFPAPWGALAAGATGLLAVAVTGPSWHALALAAALVFPVLGLLSWNRSVWGLLGATALSLAGAALLVAAGSERETLMSIRPFAGVGATLVLPPALFLAAFALKTRSPAAWLRYLWSAEIRFAHVLVGLVGLAAVLLVVLRRGNDPLIGVPELELTIRQLLGEYFARPRFKELIGHPLALLALGMAGAGGLPQWLRGVLLTAGVVAQASILNSFSHYHTPLAISLERSLAALGISLVTGLLLLVLVRWLKPPIERWLATGQQP